MNYKTLQSLKTSQNNSKLKPSSVNNISYHTQCQLKLEERANTTRNNRSANNKEKN